MIERVSRMPHDDDEPALQARYESLARVLALGVAMLGIGVLAGWATDVTALKSLRRDWVPMTPDTAIGFALTGLSLWAAGRSRSASHWRALHFATALMVTLLGVFSLFEGLHAVEFDAARLAAALSGSASADGLWAQRMALATAAGFTLTGSALLSLDSQRGRLLSQAPAFAQHCERPALWRGGVVIGCRHRAGKLWLEVWDSGIGIAADKTAEIFEEFTQLGDEGRTHGSGLGLAIAAKTAALLGLEIAVRSRPGRGSVFAVEVPRGPAASGVAAKQAHAPSRALTIALVEDNRTVRDTLASGDPSRGCSKWRWYSKWPLARRSNRRSSPVCCFSVRWLGAHRNCARMPRWNCSAADCESVRRPAVTDAGGNFRHASSFRAIKCASEWAISYLPIASSSMARWKWIKPADGGIGHRHTVQERDDLFGIDGASR